MVKTTSKEADKVALYFAKNNQFTLDYFNKYGLTLSKTLIKRHLKQTIQLLLTIKDSRLSEEDKGYLIYVIKQKYNWWINKFEDEEDKKQYKKI